MADFLIWPELRYYRPDQGWAESARRHLEVSLWLGDIGTRCEKQATVPLKGEREWSRDTEGQWSLSSFVFKHSAGNGV